MSEAAPEPSYSWYHKLGSLLLVIFCFEMGVFLLVFPWMDRWEGNYFAWLAAGSARQAEFAQWWHGVWLSPFFRGAVSGLGLVNIAIAMATVFGLRRYAEKPEEPVS